MPLYTAAESGGGASQKAVLHQLVHFQCSAVPMYGAAKEKCWCISKCSDTVIGGTGPSQLLDVSLDADFNSKRGIRHHSRSDRINMVSCAAAVRKDFHSLAYESLADDSLAYDSLADKCTFECSKRTKN